METPTLPSQPAVEFAMLHHIAIIGAAMLARVILTPEHFHDPRNRVVFETWHQLAAEGKPIDLTTTTAEFFRLSKTGAEQGGPGLDHLTAIYTGRSEYAERNVIADDPVSYAAMLEEYRSARCIVTACTRAAIKASRVQDSLDTIKAGLFRDLAESESRKNESRTESSIVEIQLMLEDCEVGESAGMATGIPPWDMALKGIYPARFYVVGARPKVGKSALCEQVAQTLNCSGRPVLFFQRDMSVRDMVIRMACRELQVCYEDFATGVASAEERDRVRRGLALINPKLMRVYSPANMTADELAAIVRREKEQSGVEVFFVDLFQRIKTHGSRDRVEGLSDAANTIRDVIQDTGVAGVVIAEVLKEADKSGRPHSGMFKWCDGLFSCCDTSILLWSDDDPKKLAGEGKMRRQRVMFSIDANRGSVSDQEMWFDRPMMTFHAKPE